MAITFRCNSKCIMCDIWQLPNQAEIEPEHFAKLPSSIKNINMTGGEPFLRDDLTEIVSIINKTCGHPRLVFSCNGLATPLIEKRVRELLEKTQSNLAIRISIHGIEERHDEVMGIPGAFQRSMGTIKMLKGLGITDLGLAFTGSNKSIDQLLDVYSLAEKLGVDFVFCGIAHNSEIYFGNPNDAIHDKELFEKQINGMIMRDLKSQKAKKWFRAYYGAGVCYHAFTGQRKIPCGAAKEFFWMNPAGDIFPDMVLNRKLGNLREQTFDEIWNGEEAEKFREEIRTKGCPSPCWMSCTVVPYMKSNLLRTSLWVGKNKLRAHLGMSVKQPSEQIK